jgi:ubiquinone/menaquinone biosynthesis C-methylase UbiE
MHLTAPAHLRDGIWFPNVREGDTQADAVWSKVARQNAVNAAAATHDPNPFAKYPDWIRPVLSARTGTLLDAGCGYGRISIPLLRANRGLRCVGVDASPVMLEKYVQLARQEGVDDRVELYCGNIDTLPFADSYFDSVVSCAVLLHLPKPETKRIVGEMRRVLAPNGVLVLAGSFPNALNVENLANLRHHFQTTKNGPVRAYLRSEVRALFDGFSQVDVEAHEMIVLPRTIGPIRMPFADISRAVNRYCSRRMIASFRHSSCFVNHHDVVARK